MLPRKVNGLPAAFDSSAEATPTTTSPASGITMGEPRCGKPTVSTAFDQAMAPLAD
jgi:hypothetical protein